MCRLLKKSIRITFFKLFNNLYRFQCFTGIVYPENSGAFLQSYVLSTVVPLSAFSGDVPSTLFIIDLREKPTIRGKSKMRK